MRLSSHLARGFAFFTLILLGAFISSCVSFDLMPEDEIRRLTHCNISLKQAKKNLILAGYGIDRADDDAIITDYKQIGQYRTGFHEVSASRFLRRISVVKLESGKIKIVPRFRTVYIRVYVPAHGVAYLHQSRQAGGIDETGPSYLEIHREKHSKIRREVCGDDSPSNHSESPEPKIETEATESTAAPATGA